MTEAAVHNDMVTKSSRQTRCQHKRLSWRCFNYITAKPVGQFASLRWVWLGYQGGKVQKREDLILGLRVLGGSSGSEVACRQWMNGYSHCSFGNSFSAHHCTQRLSVVQLHFNTNTHKLKHLVD